jgi:Flp pilus assembly protein TadB
VLVSVALLIYTAVSDISIFYLAALLLGIGLVLYAVNFLVKRRVDRETPQARE